MKKKLYFLAQMGAPGRYDPAVFANQPGGDNEIHWFERMLADLKLSDRIEFEGRRICYGEPLPDPAEADAVVIGGSFHSVHDKLPWQADLKDWLTALRRKKDGPPVFGICGGHQMMAVVHGAPVEMLEDGARVGTFPISLTDAGRLSPLFDGIVPRFHFGNEEHVPVVPAGAEVLATAPGMPACALDFGRNWMSVQFHPEATAGCMTESWGPRAKEIADHYAPTPDSPLLIANFLKATGVL